MIARVTLELALRKEFDYAIPAEFLDKVDVGSRVKVPFGPRQVLGVVTAIIEESTHTNLKPILKVVGRQTLVTPKILELARWIGDYYCCAPEIALKSVLPEAVRKEKEGWKEQLFVRFLAVQEDGPKLTSRQSQILKIVEERNELPLQELLELAQTTTDTVRKLEDKGFVAIASKISERDPYAKEKILPTQPLPLNAEQQVALERITKAMGGTGVSPVVSGVPPETVEGRAHTQSTAGNIQPCSTSPDEGHAPSKITPSPHVTPEIRRDAEPGQAGHLFHPAQSRGISEITAHWRSLPHFEIPGKIYHVTWRTHCDLQLSDAAKAKVLAACHFWHGKKLRCYIACVMSDHVHMLIQPLPIRSDGKEVHSLTELLHSIKSFSSHEVNDVMKRNGPVWQTESFDRMIRSETDLHEKYNYIWNNPRTLGLVGPMKDYAFIWVPGGTGVSSEAVGGRSQSPSTSRSTQACSTSPDERPASSKITPSTHVTPEIRRDAEFGQAGRLFHPKKGSTLTFLLHGVTGSGKTEVYLQAIAHALEQDKGAIVLVPEISLTPQTVERFKARFSSGPLRTLVAVLHSHLSAGERHDEWHKIRQGRAKIVIGARSAIFAPVDPLGLIIVDEEHEHSYKQEEAPRYNARDVAVVRGQMENAVVVLGSATPSLESFYNVQRGKYQLLELPHRADDKKMPIVRVIDMRSAAKQEKGTPIFSPQLKEAITQRLERKEQVILFLNRRGFSTSLQCPKCGYVAECPNCSVSLTYHRAAQKLCCHICGHEAKAPTTCPDAKCRNPEIRYSGLGTEKVEATLAKLFPMARVCRMDSDALKRKEDYRRILGDFRTGKIDILVGTQMIAKGLHFPNVTLVGIIYADLSLHMPDFRAGERTFQLLTQVAGRAGRGDIEGEVFVQAFTPFHPSIQYARRHDFAGFYEQEIEFREQLKYPPISRIALLTIKGRNEDKVKFSADHVKRELEKALKDVKDLMLLGPSPAPLARAETYFRYQIMLRAKQMSKLSDTLAQLLQVMALPEEVSLSVDIDPVNLS